MAISSHLTERRKKRKWSGLCPHVTECISVYSWLIQLKWKKIRTKLTEVCSLCVIVILSVFWVLLLVGNKKCYANRFSVSQQIKLVLCHNSFMFYSDNYDNDDEIDEHQPFPSLSQVISFLLYPRAFIQKQLSFLTVLVIKPKRRSSSPFIPRYSTLFPNMWVSTLRSNGFVRWKWG